MMSTWWRQTSTMTTTGHRYVFCFKIINIYYIPDNNIIENRHMVFWFARPKFYIIMITKQTKIKNMLFNQTLLEISLSADITVYIISVRLGKHRSINIISCADSKISKKGKICRFIVWYQVWRPIIRLYILPPGHWTCSFVCHFNSTESIQSCSRFGALNLSYTLPSLSYQVLISTWVKWSIWGWSALSKDTTS